MKTGLTKREKLLIFIAVAAVMIFAAFKYGIDPLHSYYSAKSGEYDALTLEKMMMEIKLESEALTRENHSSYEAVFQEIEQKYPAVMPNEEIDRILTGLCLQNGLSPVALRISDAVDFVPARQEGEQEEQRATEGSERPAAFSTVNATMLLSGNYRSLKNLIAAVEKIDYIRIGSVSLVYGQDGEPTNASNISALFELTMRNIADKSEAE